MDCCSETTHVRGASYSYMNQKGFWRNCWSNSLRFIKSSISHLTITRMTVRYYFNQRIFIDGWESKEKTIFSCWKRLQRSTQHLFKYSIKVPLQKINSLLELKIFSNIAPAKAINSSTTSYKGSIHNLRLYIDVESKVLLVTMIK